ncbi:MAG: addiction module protein [Cyanothece sp. SIO1E1]|nr:addiction module protein [Cyanothece sp. SIO1E1]
MSIQDLKSELSKLEWAELLDILQYGLEVIKEMEESSSETPDWLKAEILSRAQQIKSGQEQTYSWEEVKNYAKASNA